MLCGIPESKSVLWTFLPNAEFDFKDQFLGGTVIITLSVE